MKKIPKQVLSRCEWGHDDYSLQVENLPKAPPSPGQPEGGLGRGGKTCTEVGRKGGGEPAVGCGGPRVAGGPGATLGGGAASGSRGVGGWRGRTGLGRALGSGSRAVLEGAHCTVVVVKP